MNSGVNQVSSVTFDLDVILIDCLCAFNFWQTDVNLVAVRYKSSV